MGRWGGRPWLLGWLLAFGVYCSLPGGSPGTPVLEEGSGVGAVYYSSFLARGKRQKLKVLSVFFLRCFWANSMGTFILVGRAGKVERALEQMALFLCSPWWPSTPPDF